MKFGSTLFPNKYLKASSYNATPYQRTELEAYRDNNNLLHRTTSPNHKTKIAFDTMPVTLNEKMEIQNIIASSMSNSTERKVNVTYWNDEVNCYINSDFYIPDVTYPIIKVQGNNIYYDSISYELIEY